MVSNEKGRSDQMTLIKTIESLKENSQGTLAEELVLEHIAKAEEQLAQMRIVEEVRIADTKQVNQKRFAAKKQFQGYAKQIAQTVKEHSHALSPFVTFTSDVTSEDLSIMIQDGFSGETLEVIRTDYEELCWLFRGLIPYPKDDFQTFTLSNFDDFVFTFRIHKTNTDIDMFLKKLFEHTLSNHVDIDAYLLRAGNGKQMDEDITLLLVEQIQEYVLHHCSSDNPDELTSYECIHIGELVIGLLQQHIHYPSYKTLPKKERSVFLSKLYSFLDDADGQTLPLEEYMGRNTFQLCQSEGLF